MTILPFLWKTEIIVVDDAKYFVAEICDNLKGSRLFSAKGFSYPKQALEYVKNSKEHLPHLIESNDDSMAVDFDSIRHMMESSEKQSSISTLVVDYSMPGCTGIEFFEKIKSTNYKKIMLTAMLDPSDAIDHKGDLFDDYMQKASDGEVFKRLKDKIEKQVYGYLYSMASTVIWCLHHTAPNSLIFSEEFAEYFNQLLEELNIIEYYIVDEVGSFRLKGQGKQYLLYVQSEEDMNASVAEYDDIEDEGIKQSLKKFEVIPAIIKAGNLVILPEPEDLAMNLNPVSAEFRYNGINRYVSLIPCP